MITKLLDSNFERQGRQLNASEQAFTILYVSVQYKIACMQAYV